MLLIEYDLLFSFFHSQCEQDTIGSGNPQRKIQVFLDVASQFHKSSCLSIGQLVDWLVSQLVCSSRKRSMLKPRKKDDYDVSILALMPFQLHIHSVIYSYIHAIQSLIENVHSFKMLILSKHSYPIFNQRSAHIAMAMFVSERETLL